MYNFHFYYDLIFQTYKVIFHCKVYHTKSKKYYRNKKYTVDQLKVEKDTGGQKKTCQ